MKKSIILLMMLPSISIADNLLVHVGSHHKSNTYYDEDHELQEYNGNNFGLGYSYDMSESTQGRVGFYKNSYNKDTKYVGLHYHGDNLGIQIGVVSGYFTPFMIVPTLSLDVAKDLKVEVSVMPFKDYAIGLTIGWRL